MIKVEIVRKNNVIESINAKGHANYDKYGNYFDWVEIYNPSDEDIVLETLYITDNIKNLKKYKVPTLKLKSKEYFITCENHMKLAFLCP